MKILHVITGLRDGGAEGVLYRLCTSDRENSHIVISLIDRGKYGEPLENRGVLVYALGMPPGKLSLKGLVYMFKLIRRHKPDVVQTWMYHADLIGGIVARLAGIKAIVWGIRHTTLVLGKSKKSTIWIARILARLSATIPAGIAVCAEKAVEVHGTLGYDTKKMQVIPNGYDLSRFKPDLQMGSDFLAGLGIDKSQPLLGMVGRYNPQKDHENLLESLSILCTRGFSFHCLLIGKDMDDSNEELLQAIKSKNLKFNVRLLGQQTNIPAIMNALDIHVLSSSFGEAFPNVLAEAMACGTPCVSTDVGDAKRIVGDTGWIVPPSNPVMLADAIGTALGQSNSADWQDRCHRVRQRIENNFEIGHMIEAYSRLWKAMVVKTTNRPRTV